MQLAFLGLGNMGEPIAANLLAAGHRVRIWNRSPGRGKPLETAGAERVASPEAAAAGSEVAFTMLANDAALEAVLAGLLAGLKPGATHVSLSTLSPELVDTLDQNHRLAGVSLVSAPVFGRPEAAAAKKLWVIAAGEAAVVARCRPLLDAIGQGVFVVGERPSVANGIKLAGNFLIASVLESLGEAFALARKTGVPAESFLEIVNTALFRSPLYASYGALIAGERFDPAGFALALGLKDVRLVTREADRLGVVMPFASQLHDRFLSAVGRGLGDQDWSAIARLIAEDAGFSK